ncbi:hypothetical protein [Actinomycetospora chlora]|uniref:hypothetical protein n=1 Tax=Actinomycetospora chlora TaxID=663608 RepID=UPI0031EFE90E
MAPTAADRLTGGGVVPAGAAGPGRDERRDGRRDRRPDPSSMDQPSGTGSGTPEPSATTPAGPSVGPGASVGTAGAVGTAGTAGTPGVVSPDALQAGPAAPQQHGPAASHPAGGDVPLVPPATGAATTSPERPSGPVRHPEYLVDADPWRDPADDPEDRRLVTPPVIGEQDSHDPGSG